MATVGRPGWHPERVPGDEIHEVQLTVGEIARRWEQSPTTVRRHMAAGTLRGAGQVGRGFWSAPFESVIAQYGPEPARAQPAEIDELRQRLAEAVAARDAAVHRIDVLEAIKAGQADTIAALRLALSIKVLPEAAARVDVG
jgi:predicted transcriptional regulator